MGDQNNKLSACAAREGRRLCGTLYMEKYNTGTCSLAYECAGPEDGVPLVFLHGATVDHVSMKNTFEDYFTGAGRGYRRVYMDLPGHGESGCSVFRANMADMLKDVGSFLHSSFERPPCVVGYSMGGFLALKLGGAVLP